MLRKLTARIGSKRRTSWTSAAHRRRMGKSSTRWERASIHGSRARKTAGDVAWTADTSNWATRSGIDAGGWRERQRESLGDHGRIDGFNPRHQPAYIRRRDAKNLWNLMIAHDLPTKCGQRPDSPRAGNRQNATDILHWSEKHETNINENLHFSSYFRRRLIW